MTEEMTASWLREFAGDRVQVRSAASMTAGQGIDAVGPIRDKIKGRVEALLAKLIGQ